MNSSLLLLVAISTTLAIAPLAAGADPLPSSSLRGASGLGRRSGATCGEGAASCGGRCVVLESDSYNCGGCGRACGFSQACCGGACSDLMNDGLNCGGCGSACPEGGPCSFGMCSYGA